MESHAVEIGGKPRFRTGDAKIGNQRQAEPAPDRGAVDGGDDRLLVAEQPGAFLVEMLGLAVPDIARGCGIETLGEIRAGAERLALRRKHDGAALRIGVERIEGLGDRADERIVEIIVRRPPDLDRGDVAGQAHAEVSKLRSDVHGNLPVGTVGSIVWPRIKIKRSVAARQAYQARRRGSHHCAARCAARAAGSAGGHHRT